MSKREEAWQWARDGWHPHEPTDEIILGQVRASIRRLQAMPLPVAAIRELQNLLYLHEEYVLEDLVDVDDDLPLVPAARPWQSGYTDCEPVSAEVIGSVADPEHRRNG